MGRRRRGDCSQEVLLLAFMKVSRFPQPPVILNKGGPMLEDEQEVWPDKITPHLLLLDKLLSGGIMIMMMTVT